jgi:hypothetical protein
VIVLADGRPARSASTVNRMLTAVFGFYDFHARHGVEVAKVLIDQTRSGRGSYEPFLHGIARAKPRGRVGEQLIASAQASGAQRLMEINEPVRINLIRIIEGLDALPTFDGAADNDG